MPAPAAPPPAEPAARKSAGPGRPKDLAKRAAILDSAKAMFIQHGFDGASMDQIAAAAGVSKLTVYSHFGDKDALFAAAVKAYCEQRLPSSMFARDPGTPLRERLLTVARAFYAMVTGAEAVAGHRMLCSPQLLGSPLSRLFWDAGPGRVNREFGVLLQQRIDAGELDIADVPLAAAQFFALLKGQPHAMLVLGCCELDAAGVERHLAASVDLFVRAYRPAAGAQP